MCGLVRVPGKSTLQDYVSWLPKADMQKVLATLHTALADEDKAAQIGMEAELESVIACADSSCLKANVHFPTDWVLLRDAVHMREQSGGDARILAERLPVIQANCGGDLCGVIGDRGFSSDAIDCQIEEAGLFNGICPKNRKKLADCMKEGEFRRAMQRRAQIEGRAGILKNVFLGGIPLAKGFERRRVQVSWAVLAHNLWVAARLPWKEDRREQDKAA